MSQSATSKRERKMDDELVPVVSVITLDIFEIRDERVMLDSRVAQSFGTETKRINEAVARNPDKFSKAHTFQLSQA